MITADTLPAALASAKPGDILKLSGSFGDVLLRGDRLARDLTLDMTAATITGQVKGVGMVGLRLVGGVWRGKQPLRLDRCTGVRVTGGTYEGPGAFDANLADGYAVFVVVGQDVTIEGLRAEGFKSGVVLSKVTGFAVTGCGLARMRSDGIQAGECRQGLIADNVIHGTKTLWAEHPDGIQIWSRPTSPPTADIVIERNLVVGDTQGICGFNVVRNGVNDGGYDRITIRDNRVVAGHPQGIALTEARDSVVENNTVSTWAGARWRASINLTRCERTIRRGNTVAAGAGKPSADDPP